jgi:hypothetical protein
MSTKEKNESVIGAEKKKVSFLPEQAVALKFTLTASL